MSYNGWKRYKLKEFAELVKDQYLPNSEENLVYIGLEHIEQQTLRLNGAGNSSDVISQKFRFKGGDILFGKLRPYFRKVYRPKFNGVCSTDIWVVRAKEGFDQGFLFYFLASQEFVNESNSGSSGTRMPRADWSHLADTEWNLPNLSTQRRIADILSALDDKIELNHQTNATLEAITQSIFKEWFVDFNFPDPKGLSREHAASEGMESGKNGSRQAGQTFRVSDMAESELGMIPQGWRVGSILEIADLLSGGTPSTQVSEYWDGQIKWVSAKDVSNAQGTFVLDTERKVSQIGVDNSSTKLLPALTTIVTARGTVGSYCILAEPMTMNQTNYGLKAKKENTDYFVFLTLGNLVAHLRQVSYGTIFDTVTTKTFEQSRIVIPPAPLIVNFDLQVKAVMQNVLNNLEEITILESLRDAILPRLMSGEIEV